MSRFREELKSFKDAEAYVVYFNFLYIMSNVEYNSMQVMKKLYRKMLNNEKLY